MSSTISSCRVSLTGSRIIIASASTSATRRSSCLHELVHLRHLSRIFSKMTKRKARHGVMYNGTSLTKEGSRHCLKNSEEWPAQTGNNSSKPQEEVDSEEEPAEEAVATKVDPDLASSAERPLTWRRTALILTKVRGGSMAAAEAAEVAVMIFLQEEAAEIKR